MQKLIKPDWKHSILNISATLAEFLGAPNRNATLPLLKNRLTHDYKNVVYVCFDGMGINPLERNLAKDDFLRRHIAQTLTSTFPSTTTNATTSLCTNKLPLEHGWLGWSMRFDEIGRNVDIFLNKDSQTGEEVVFDSPLADYRDGYFYHALRTDYQIRTIYPKYVKCKQELNTVAENVDEFFAALRNVCKEDGKHFVYAYCPEPDGTMHDNGVTCPETKALLRKISQGMRTLAATTENTLFIVSADHGQVDVEGYVDWREEKELDDMLECPPYLDSRSPCFRVKKGMKRKFARLFRKKYGKDFVLFSTKHLIKHNYFGDRGNYGYLLGDFVASGTYTNKMFILPKADPHYHKGHHTALTREMLVPMILIESGDGVSD